MLGLKGQISELELHTIRSRLDRGKLNKARRGELIINAPIGYVKTPAGGLVLDPDEQVRAVVRLLFDKFEELGTAHAVTRYLRQNHIRLGIRPHDGPNRGEPRMAPGSGEHRLPHPHPSGLRRDVCLRADSDRTEAPPPQRSAGHPPRPDGRMGGHPARPPAGLYHLGAVPPQHRAHPPEPHHGLDPGPRAPGRRPAVRDRLLRAVRAADGRGLQHQVPAALSLWAHHQPGESWACRGITAAALDAAVADQVLQALTPAGIELSLTAAGDIERERARLDAHWQAELQRGGYEARLAERSYRAVDPDNRLVARTLEQRWEEALRREQELREGYDRFRRESPRRLTSEELDRIRALAADIPSLWHAAETPAADRKEIVRALVERVTVTVAGDSESVLVRIRWMGGTTTEHALRRPISHYERLADFPRIRRLVEAAVAAGRTSREIAECLNREGFRPPSNRADRFTPERARDLVYRLGLSPRRRPAEGLAVNEWWIRDLADGLGVGFGRFKEWVKRGYVHARRVGSRKHLVIWADAEERERLCRLRDAFRPGQTNPYPAELTRPKARPAQSPGALCARDAALDP